MSPIRTRKRSFAASLAAVWACAFATNAAAATLTASDLRVTMPEAPSASAFASRQFGLVGRAPSRCVPRIGRVSVEGADLSVELAPPDTCAAGNPSPFYLRLDPEASARIVPGQVYRTRIYSNDGGAATLLAFGLLDTNNRESAPRPENGMWWSEASVETGAASAGSGASIELQDGRLAVGLFGFGETGAATWYFGTARPEGRVARVALVQLQNGDPPFAPPGNQPTAQAGPRLELEFLSPSRARAYLVRSDSGHDVEVRALTLSRSRFASGALGTSWSGQWVLVPDDGGTPRVFDLSAAGSQDAENFHLADAAGDARLDCRLVAGTGHPDVCTLSASSLPPTDFDQIGLDRLSGRTDGGIRVTLMRVTR